MDSLIKIEGKPLEKLIDVVSNAIGTLYKPRQIEREARAEAKAETIKAIEHAKTQAILDGDLDKVQYLGTINERLVAKEIKRQKNIENVIAVAGKVLQAEETVSEESVNPDWATRFFDISQDVSDEKMQNLWGQILAGEIKQPQSYSLRALEILRNMTKEEAEIFQKVAQFALYQTYFFLFSPNKVLEKLEVPYYNIAKLIEIGLLQSGDFASMNFDNKENEKIEFLYGDFALVVNFISKQEVRKISFPIKLFTTAGEELLQLIDIIPNMNYIQEFAKAIKKDDVEVGYAEVICLENDGTIRYKDPVIL